MTSTSSSRKSRKGAPRPLALALAGLLAGTALTGTVLTGALSASAATPDAPASVDQMSPGGPSGLRGEAVDEAARSAVAQAVLDDRPDAVVEHVHKTAGGYHAHVRDGDERLVVTLDEGFVVTGTQTRPVGPAGKGPGGEDELTGATAAKVRASVLAKYPGATVERLETDADGVYEAHVTTSDGERVVVEVDASFTVTGTQTRPASKPGGPGKPDGRVPFGPGEVAGTKASAAVAQAVRNDRPDAVVERVQETADGYRAHVRDGDERLVVTLDEDFVVTGTQTPPAGPGGRRAGEVAPVPES